jgi:hypothetical protein
LSNKIYKYEIIIRVGQEAWKGVVNLYSRLSVRKSKTGSSNGLLSARSYSSKNSSTEKEGSHKESKISTMELATSSMPLSDSGGSEAISDPLPVSERSETVI